jgi:ethanolamine utilization protein EutQ (cupin superfamily)
VIAVLPTSAASPAVVPDDDEHYGPAVSAYEVVWRSGDGGLLVGVWDFRGEQRTRPRHVLEHGYEEITTIVAGFLEVECDGVAVRLEAGDTVVYDCPIGAKHLRAPDGFRGIYVVRYHGGAGGGRVVKLGDVPFESADGKLGAGLWESEGESRGEAADGYDEVLVITRGALDVASEGSQGTASAGDVVIYSAPLAAKTVRAAALGATYVVHSHGATAEP